MRIEDESATTTEVICPAGYVIDAPKLDAKGRPEGRGTLHFAPGQQVFVMPMHGYDIAHYERAQVAGYHREDGRLCVLWIDLRRLKDFAAVVVEDKKIRHQIRLKQSNSSVKPWTPEEAHRFAEWRNGEEKTDWEGVVWENASHSS